MFTRSAELSNACASLINATKQPAIGTIITGLHGLPIRVHCQIRRQRPGKGGADTASQSPEVFAYATIVGMSGQLVGSSQTVYYAQDFASSDFHGTKAVLMAGSRAETLRRGEEDPMLRNSDVLPVKEIRIVGVSESGRSLKCEVTKYCDAEETEVCAAVVAAAQRQATIAQKSPGGNGDVQAQKALADTVEGFYAFFNERHVKQQTAAVAATAAAALMTAQPPADAADDDDVEIEDEDDLTDEPDVEVVGTTATATS